MKRDNVFKNRSQDNLTDHKQRIAFHEAGHAMAIYLNNKARNLPPVFFQIVFKDLFSESEDSLMVYQVTHDDYIARIKGGRSIKSASSSSSIDTLMHQKTESIPPIDKDRLIGLEVNIINLLVGPLAEAKHSAETDDELFNQKLINLSALNNYGGSSDLEQAYANLQNFFACKQQQDEKMNELFCLAFHFIKDRTNWSAITRLANYILDSNKTIISCEEVAALIEY